jgi:carbonic anhydrase
MPLETLLDGHRRFKETFERQREAFVQLADKGQSPLALWIGCSDSRVIPEQITGAAPGQLYVLRTPANLVPPFGTGSDAVGAAIEHAIVHLHIAHAIICGHTLCGGIQALEGGVSLTHEPHLARWIEWARPARTWAEASGVPQEARYLETVKANVLVQCENLRSYPCVREAVKAGRLVLHAWLYDLHTGDLSAYDDEAGQWRALVPPEEGK